MSKRLFHPGLEGLRGVSVLAVLVFHADALWLPGGFLGVSTFFTLSGFLITGLLTGEWRETGQIRLGRFWSRRLRRLLPASIVALLAIAVVGPGLADGTQLNRLAGDGIAALFYVSNWWLIVTGAAYDGLMGSPSLVQHFWSLSIEEQYYFVYPLFMFALLHTSTGSTRFVGAVLAALVLASWGWMMWLAGSDVTTARIYYGTDTRAGELLAGGVLAVAVSRRAVLRSRAATWSALGGGVAGLAITTYGWSVADVEGAGLYTGGIAAYTIGTLAVIYAAIQPGGPVRWFLSLTPLRWLGRISYGAYVYHWPIFLAVENDLARFALTLAAADLSYRVLEEPIRAGRRVLGWRRFVLPPAAIATVAFALMITAPETLSLQAKVPDTTTRVPSRPKLRIAMAGDSLARDVGEGLSMWAEQSGFAEVVNTAIRGCGIARGAWPASAPRNRTVCDTWPDRTAKRLAEFRPDVVLVVTAGWDLGERRLPEWNAPKIIGDPDFDQWMLEEYEAAVDVFTATGAHVVWMTTPCRRNEYGIMIKSWDPARSRHMNDHILTGLIARRPDQVSLLDFEAAICPDGEFAKSVHGIENFRRDGTHLSDPGKLWVGTWIGEELLGE